MRRSSGRAKQTDRLAGMLPWVLLAIVVVLPVYAVAISFSIRTGLFDIDKKTVTADETKAVWSLVGSGLAGAATLTGLLLTRSHNRRTERRLVLDTAVSSLGVISAGDSGYAPRAAVAGALATLVHLGHPVIAMRSLSAAWDDNAIDVASAVWLISEVYESESESAQTEAAALLERRAKSLAGSTPQEVYWPSALFEQWQPTLPIDARINMVFTLLNLLMSHPKAWWQDRHGWVTMTLDEVVRRDPDPLVRSLAARAVLVLVSADLDSQGISHRTGWRTVGDIRARASKSKTDEGLLGDDELIADLVAWEGAGPSVDR